MKSLDLLNNATRPLNKISQINRHALALILILSTRAALLALPIRLRAPPSVTLKLIGRMQSACLELKLNVSDLCLKVCIVIV